MKTIEISDSAFAYLQAQAVPLQDTTVSVLDRLIDEHICLGSGALKQSETPEAKLVMAFGLENMPNVSFTTIDAATINGLSVKRLFWNDILAEMIAVAVKLGGTKDEFGKLLSAQIHEGKPADNGHWHVKGTDISFQGLDAVRACKNIAALSKVFSIAVSIHLRWQANPKAQFAGSIGHLVLP